MSERWIRERNESGSLSYHRYFPGLGMGFIEQPGIEEGEWAWTIFLATGVEDPDLIFWDRGGASTLRDAKEKVGKTFELIEPLEV